MAVDIPDRLTDLASDIDVSYVMPRKTTRARSQKIYSMSSSHGFYRVSLNWSLLTDEQADELASLFEYANSQGGQITLRLGVRSRAGNAGFPMATPAAIGDSTVTVSGVTVGTKPLNPGAFFTFAGHSKMYRAAASTDADGAGQSVITFSPPLRSAENSSITIDGVTFTALLPPETTDKWSGGTGRSDNLDLEEWL